MGNDFEHSLWGSIGNIVGAGRHYSRHHLSLAFALGVETYPDESMGLRLDAPIPVIRYIRPIPLDYVAKLFRKSFWALEFEAYGFGALKMRPDNTPQLNVLRNPTKVDLSVEVGLYGRQLAKFLQAVPSILIRSRQHALGSYLEALQIEMVYRHQWARWWTKEIKNWREDLFHPLKGSMELLTAEFERAHTLHRQRFAVDQKPFYMAWRDAQPPATSKSFPAWGVEIEQGWEAVFRYGGWLMQRLLAAHNDMQDDIGAMERMVLYFLSIKPADIYYNLTGTDTERNIVRIIYHRLSIFRQHARNTVNWIGDVSRIPQLIAGADKWIQWQARFESNEAQYEELILMLEQGSRPDSEEFDVIRKARFRRLPTADWKHTSERFKKIALREYTRADVAVRDTIDEFLRQFKRLDPISSQGEDMIDQVESAIKSLDDIDRRADRVTSSIFDFVAPSARSESGSSGAIKRSPGSPPGKGAIFGVPGEAARRRSSLGGNPPRRIMSLKRPDASRVRKPSSDTQKVSGYKRYITNLLTTPEPERASKTLNELLQSGAPQPILDLLPAHKQLAPGGGGLSIAPFPNPFASRTVMTSEALAFQQQKELAKKAARAKGEASGIYVARSLWREKYRNDDSDDDER